MRYRAHVLFALYLAAVVYLSLFPFDFQFYPRTGQLIWTPLSIRGFALDALLNVFFYAPLGFLGAFVFGRRWWSALMSVVAAASVSWVIEHIQLWTPTRVGSWTDFFANSLGATLGAVLAMLLLSSGFFDKLALRSYWSRWSLPPARWLMLSWWFLWLGFPFVPAVRIFNLMEFAHPEPWSWIYFVQFLVGAMALRGILGTSTWMWVACAALPAQAFMREHLFSYAALTGTASGVLFASILRGRLSQLSAWILPLYLVFEELRPFTLSPSARPFVWEPFQSWYESSPEHYYPLIFGKLFLYTSGVWFLRGDPARPSRGWLTAVAIPAVILAGGEWAQQYISGRTPESTDVVLLLAGAALLALCPARMP